MSHFTVLVIGDNPEEQLAPFHEFECTGLDDQYVIDIDETQEYRERYESETSTRCKDENGALHSPWDDTFYRDPTPEEEKRIGAGTGFGGGLSWTSKDWKDGKGFRTKIHFMPEGFQEVECKTSDLMSFTAYCIDYHEITAVPAGETPDLTETHKYRYCLLDEAGTVIKVVRRTNPNKKWDWYALGGRWAGFFRLKKGAAGVQEKPGLFAEPAKEGHADAALKSDIDFARMRSEVEVEAAQKFDAVRSIIEPHLPLTGWSTIREKYCPEHGEAELPGGIEAARKAYHAQPAVKALREVEEFRFEDAKDYTGDRNEFIRRAGTASFMTFAVIKDGQWYERGEMGWWGVVLNEKHSTEWVDEFAKLIDGLPEDTLLSVYDCHI